MASGWHFAKESLSLAEHRMLLVIEELLKEIDGDGFEHVWPSSQESSGAALPSD
jgi:hypothetical protein